MPILPSRDDIKPVGADPTGHVISYNPTALTNAQQEAGRSMSQSGEKLIAYGEVETEKLNNLKADEALTKSMAIELDLLKKDRESKNGQVLDPEYHKSSEERYKNMIQTGGAGLTSEQRAKYEKVMNRRKVAFDAGRYEYSVGEAARFKKTEFSSRMSVRQQQGAAVYNDSAKFQEVVMGTDNDVVAYLVSEGVTDPKSDTMITARQENKAAVWNTAIEQALVSGDTATANRLYSDALAGKVFTPEQRRALDTRMKPANDFEEGQVLAITAKKMLDSGRSQEDIEMWIVEQKPSPGAYNAVQAILTNVRQGHTIAQAEVKGTVLEMYSKAGANAAAMAKVLQSPEYARMTEAQQGEISNYMRENAEQATRAAKADYRADKSAAREDIRWADYGEAKARERKQYEGFGKFFTIMNDPRFPTMSRQEIFALTPEIGKDNVVKLLAEQKAVSDLGKKFKIDKDILDAAIPEKLLEKGHKDELNAFRGFVESELMDWKTQNPGKEPPPDVQRKIATSANYKWLEVKDWWPDTEHKAFEGPPDAWVNKLKASAKKSGKTLTPEQIHKAWREDALQGQ